MASLNKVLLIGNLGRDPEIRYLPSGDAVASLNIATTETWKDKNGEKEEKTEWHRVSMFGRLAEIAGEYLKKGSQVYIEGRIETRKYTDKDGVEKYATEIKASEMKMLGGRGMTGGTGDMDSAPRASSSRSGGGASSAPAKAPAGGAFDDLEDDIPF